VHWPSPYVGEASLYAVSCFEHSTLAPQAHRRYEQVVSYSFRGGAKDLCDPLPLLPLLMKKRNNAKNEGYLGLILYQSQWEDSIPPVNRWGN
jgi:hypothetical protein